LPDRRDDAVWAKVRNLTADFKGVKQVGAHSSQYKTLERPVKLAKEIVALAAQHSKRAAAASWKQKMAAELEIDAESSEEVDDEERDGAPARAADKGERVRSAAGARLPVQLVGLEKELNAALLALNNSTSAAFRDGSLAASNCTKARLKGPLVGGRQQLDDIRKRLAPA